MFFEAGQYAINSRYRNHIAFSFDIGLLRRVLGAVCRNGVEVWARPMTLLFCRHFEEFVAGFKPFNRKLLIVQPNTQAISLAKHINRSCHCWDCPGEAEVANSQLLALVDRQHQTAAGVVELRRRGRWRGGPGAVRRPGPRC